MRIDFLGIEAFLSIAERGSFQRAAAHLNLSQTALSHRMRKLEDDLGVRLFTRSSRQVVLTPAGTELLPRARRMIGDIGAAYEALRAEGRARRTRLSVGCLPTIAVNHLPPLLTRFVARHPDVEVEIHDRSAREIDDLVEQGKAEFGLTIVSASRWDLDLRPLFKEPYVLLVPGRHPLAGRARMDWSEIEGLPLVRISSHTANRAILDDALGPRREFMTWRFEVTNLATAVRLVREGLALTVAPRLAVDLDEARDLVALPLRAPSVSRTLGVVTRRGTPLSPAGETLLALVEERFRSEAKRLEA